MSEPNRCGKCGVALPSGVLSGLCPHCLFDAAVTSETGSAPRVAEDQSTPVVIARYKIVRLIGQGGMGSVYEAEQEHPRRTVALKVIKPGFASPVLLRRFEQEAEALGRLQHPGIAQIFEAGTADTGFGPQPYFAMELIRGMSLKEYARERSLSTRERVEMVARVCDAVHHAHQKGLIHRDLKPGNILVDETGQPKIVDFGVARITDRDTQATSHTDAGQLIGTLAYMSPEQVLADPLELDTRSDVYALGVILYELLAGRLPYAIGNKLHDALETIRKSDPQPLSSVDSAYRGDLETIAAKTLEKDKNRRYASAAELGADLRRYLADEPIVARPASLRYQLGKFARRHTALVTGVAAVFVVLVGGIVTSTLQATRANRERDRAVAAESAATRARDRAVNAENQATSERDKALSAEMHAQTERDRAQQERDRAVLEKQRADNEAATAAAVSDFLRTNLLEQVAEPTTTTATPDSTMRAMLSRAAAKIEGKYPQQPLVEAGVREEIAKAFASLGANAEAAAQLERALELRRRTLGAHPATARIMAALANAYAALGRTTEADSMNEETYKMRRAVLGERHTDTLQSMIAVARAELRRGNKDDAELLASRVLTIARRAFGENDERTFDLRLELASFPGSPDEEFRVIYESASRALGENHRITLAARNRVEVRASAMRTPGVFYAIGAPPDRNPRDAASVPEMARIMSSQATELMNQKKFSEAEKIFLDALELVDKSGGQFQPLPIRVNLAIAYQSQGKYAQAEKVLLDALEIWKSGRGSPVGFRGQGLFNNLAGVYEAQGKFAEAESTLQKAVESESANGEETPATLASIRDLAAAYARHGRYADAEALYAKLVVIRRRTLGDADPQTQDAMGGLAAAYVQQRKFDQSMDLLKQLLDARRRANSPMTRVTLWTIGWVHLQSGRLAEADVTLREALSILDQTMPDSWERFAVRNMLGATLAAQKKYVEAEPLLLSGYEGMKQRNPGNINLFTLANAGEAITKFYRDSGQLEKAVAWERSSDETKLSGK
jgi:tetratricopeptide (TPR) repeat protein